MTDQRAAPCITDAELRMLQSVAATILAEAIHGMGLSRCRFGSFELTARRFENNNKWKDKIAMALIVSYAGEIIEYDRGLLPRH
jgi:hypothetical protein